jgi:hypothetical protein
MTGVEATKNSCYTIPPGSNLDGINPKSEPQLIKAPSFFFYYIKIMIVKLSLVREYQ